MAAILVRKGGPRGLVACPAETELAREQWAKSKLALSLSPSTLTAMSSQCPSRSTASTHSPQLDQVSHFSRRRVSSRPRPRATTANARWNKPSNALSPSSFGTGYVAGSMHVSRADASPQSNCDPIRLTHNISTFPLFLLSHYPSIVVDLELTSTSYINTYNSATGHWEQHLITTVRTIESGQRLVYKLRKSLLAGLADNECTGLAEELALQEEASASWHPAPSPTFTTQLEWPLADSAEVPSAKR